MQQTPYLSTDTLDFIDDFASDHDVTLFGLEVEGRDSIEEPVGSNPDDTRYIVTRYIVTRFNRTSFVATGFAWQHPRGAIISGEFAQPVVAMVREKTDDGHELTNDTFNAKLRAAIVAKCGRVSGFADSLLV